LKSIRDTLQQDKKVTIENCSIGYVGVDSKFTVIEGNDVQKYLDVLNGADGAAMDTA
jgi:20S proteasome subunit alpha 6